MLPPRVGWLAPHVPTWQMPIGKIQGECWDCDRQTGRCWRHSVQTIIVGQTYIVGEIVQIPTQIFEPQIVPTQERTWR